MAQYKINDPDDLIECPFDNTHLVRVSRMQYHLIQCKKQHHGKSFEQCPFNARHYVLKPELQHHLCNCPDRAIIENDMLFAQKQNDGTYFQGDCSVPEYNNHIINANDGEDWDAECDDSRGRFKWGETNSNEYFSRRSRNQIQAYDDYNQPIRLPRDIPKVLKTPNGLPAQVAPSRDKNSSESQRLPNTVPMTAMMGVPGRGRGVASLQKQSNSSIVGVIGQPNNHRQMNGGISNYGNQSSGVNVSQSRGRGRGYGKVPNAMDNMSSMVSNGYADEDACSNSSSASDRSSSSRSSRSAPRQVNANTIGFSNPMSQPTAGHKSRVVNRPASHPNGQLQNGTLSSDSSNSSQYEPDMPQVPHNGHQTPQNPTIPQQPAGVSQQFGLLGIGRGAGRGLNKNQFIVPNVNKSATSNDGEQEKKEIRKCEKKIREIEALEIRSMQGETMNDAEKAKIESKKDLLAQLRVLHLQCH